MNRNEIKTVFGVIGGLILIIIIVAVLKIGYTKYLAVPQENARRQVFEQTQSYTHGKIQEISKYYIEYQTASADEKEVLSNVIKTNFTTFDAGNIENLVIRSFLIKMRGF